MGWQLFRQDRDLGSLELHGCVGEPGQLFGLFIPRQGRIGKWSWISVWMSDRFSSDSESKRAGYCRAANH